MWIKLKDKRTLVNLRQVKEINIDETNTTITFKYNNHELVVKKGPDLDAAAFEDLVNYIEHFDKYCMG